MWGRLCAVMLAALTLSACEHINTGATSLPVAGSIPTPRPAPRREAEPISEIVLTPAGAARRSVPDPILSLGDDPTETSEVDLARLTPTDDGPKDITISLDNAPAKDFVSVVFGDLLQTNFVVSPDANGQISLQITEPVSKQGLRRLATSALQLNGLDVEDTDSGVVIRRITRENVRRDQAEAVRTVRLQAASAERVMTVLQPFLGANASAALMGPKAIALTGAKADLDILENIVRTVDQSRNAQSFVLVPLRSSQAEDVAEELSKTFVSNASDRQPIRITPIQRLNAVLIASEDATEIAEAQNWARILDGASSSAEEKLFVYPMRNRPATELVAILRAMFSDGDAPAPVAGAEGLISYQISSPIVKARMLVDPGRNSLIVMGGRADFDVIKSALDGLDKPKRQARIEASIIEVTLNDELSYGVRWFVEGKTQEGALSGTLSDLGSGAVASAFPGFSFILDAADARVIVDALSSVTDVQVVSSPTLLALDRETARLQVGDQVPVVTRSSSSVTDANAPIVNQVEYRDTGVILEIEPEIYANGLVKLRIEQEVSDVAETVGDGIDNPTIRQRRVSSTLILRSGQTAVLGGLTRERSSEGRSGIPLLSDLPVLGAAFGTTEESSAKTELLISLRLVL